MSWDASPEKTPRKSTDTIDTSPAMTPAKTMPKAQHEIPLKKCRVHDVYNDEQPEQPEQFASKKQKEKQRKDKQSKLEAEQDDLLANMAESVKGMASLVQESKKAAATENIYELWGRCTAKKLEDLSSRRARRLMYHFKCMLLEAHDEEVLELEMKERAEQEKRLETAAEKSFGGGDC